MSKFNFWWANRAGAGNLLAHLLYTVGDVLLETLVLQNLDVLEQAQHKTPDAQIADHVGFENPVFLIFLGSQERVRLRVFLQQKIV